MIPVEVEEPSPRVIFRATSSQALRKEANLASKAKEMAYLREKVLKHWIANKYNVDIIPRKFQERDLVLRCANTGPPLPGQGKLVANWEGP